MNQDSTIHFDLNATQLSDSSIPAGRRSKTTNVAEQNTLNKTLNFNNDKQRPGLVNLQDIIDESQLSE